MVWHQPRGTVKTALASVHTEKQEQVMPEVNDFDVILLKDKTRAHGINGVKDWGRLPVRKKKRNSC